MQFRCFPVLWFLALSPSLNCLMWFLGTMSNLSVVVNFTFLLVFRSHIIVYFFLLLVFRSSILVYFFFSYSWIGNTSFLYKIHVFLPFLIPPPSPWKEPMLQPSMNFFHINHTIYTMFCFFFHLKIYLKDCSVLVYVNFVVYRILLHICSTLYYRLYL